MGIHLLRSVPNAALMFLSFELVSSWLAKQATKVEGDGIVSFTVPQALISLRDRLPSVHKL
jgi:hypothetical protein